MEERLRTRRWAGLVFISIAVSLIIVDSTIVNVAVPSIVDDLGISSTEVQWVQEAYTLVFASFLLVFGSLADRFGRRRLLVLGVIVFAAASIAASLAPTGGTLIASRLLQGVGGSMILPTTLSLINATFRGRERGIAFAVWGSTIGGMAAVGPLLGGWLTTAFSWRWAFGINIPLSAIIVVGVLLTVAGSRTDHRTSIDAVGAVLSVLTMAPLVFALVEGRTYGWWEVDTVPAVGAWTWPFSLSPVPIAFAVTLVALAAFVAWGVRRQRRGRSTLLALDLFRIGSFRNGNIAAAVVSLGEFGIILALPLWLQFVVGFDALQTGLLLLSLAIGSFVASAIAGALSGKVSPVAVVRGGLLAEVVGVGGVALTIGPDAAWVPLIPFLFVYGLGVGLATAQLTGVVLADVPASASGQASGTQSTSRQLGAALGVAILGTVLFSTTGTLLAGSLADRGVPTAQSDQIVAQVVDSAGAAIPGLARSPQTEDVAADARAAFSDGTRAAALTAGAFLILGLASTLTLGRGGGRTRRGAARPSGAAPSESGGDAAPNHSPE